jgi:hypothetical protein
MLEVLKSFINKFKGTKEIKDLEEINFIEINANDIIKEHPDALYDLYNSKKHGFLIKNFLNHEEINIIQKYAHDNKTREIANTPVGYTYPMIFQEFSLRNNNLKPEELKLNAALYFEKNKQFNENFYNETKVDLFGKLNLLFDNLSGGRKIKVPVGFNNIGNYLFGNFRHLHPKGGLMTVHCGNYFGKNFETVYTHLVEKIKVVNQMSYFVMIQKPDIGGELSIFNLRWVDGQGKKGFSEDEEVILSNGATIKVDKHPKIKRFPMIPEPGDMILFQGGNIWHRVEKVFGSKERITFGGFMGIDKDESTFYYWT